MESLKAMPIYQIASLIRKDWKKVYFGADPYISAMYQMNSIDDQYGFESGRGIVTRFLCNASTWRGEVAREVKKELNRRLK